MRIKIPHDCIIIICISIILGDSNATVLVAVAVFVPIIFILIMIIATVFGILLFMRYKKKKSEGDVSYSDEMKEGVNDIK